MDKKKIILLAAAALSLLGIIFIPGLIKMRTLVQENRSLERQIAQMRQENYRLKEEYQKLKTDPIYLERVAREKLGAVRQGEVIYQVLPRAEE